MRKAFDATMTDTAFASDAIKTGITADPLNGADMETLLKRIYATDPAILTMLQKAMPKKG